MGLAFHGGDALAAADARLEASGGVAHDVGVERQRAGACDEHHRRAAELEVAFLVAFRVRVAGVRLHYRADSERADIHEPEAAEVRVARDDLPFVVGIDVGIAQKGDGVDGVVLAG